MTNQFNFIATVARVQEDDCALTASLAAVEDCGGAYLMFPRNPEFGSRDDWGVYVELNNQSNSGYNRILRCTVGTTSLTIELTEPIDRQKRVASAVVQFGMPMKELRHFIAMLRRIFTGYERLLKFVGLVPVDRYRAPYGPAVAARLESFAVGLSRDYTLVRNLSASESRALAEYLLELTCKLQNGRNIELGRAIFCELPRNWSLKYLATCAAPIAAGEDDWEYRRLLELAQAIDHETCVRFAQIGKHSLNAEIRQAAEEFCEDGQST